MLMPSFELMGQKIELRQAQIQLDIILQIFDNQADYICYWQSHLQQIFKINQLYLQISYIELSMIKKSFRIFAVPLFSDNYSYIIQTCIKEPLLLVDPANPDVIIDCLNKYFVDQHVGHILYTHKHWDHAGGSENLFKRLQQKYQKLEVYAGAQDAEHIKTVTQKIQKDGELLIGKNRVQAYQVPCHTRGHTIYHLLLTQNGIDTQINNKEDMKTSQGKKIRVFEEPECAFSGDTLFCGGICRFFEGNATQMYGNISKINQKINKNVSIYNGHEYTLQNLKWGTEIQPQNEKIKELITQIQLQNQAQICTLPTTPLRQSEINVFYRAVVRNQNSLGVPGVQYLRILRQAKNKNSTNLLDFKQNLGTL